MTILVLGHLVLDEIHSLEGTIYETPGGITFPVTALASITGPDDRLVPVFPVGSDAVDTVQRILAEYPNIDPEGLYNVPERNTRVRLFHESRSHYNTQLVSALPSIPAGRFAPWLDAAQLVYLNMMTGSDLLPEDLKLLKGPGRLVYIDLHMIAYRVHDDGRREPAAGSWEPWARAADIVQCNDRELQALLGDMSDEASMVSRMFDRGELSAVVVTHGEDGASIWTAPGKEHRVPARRQESTVDPTGCGDTFGSVFAYLFAGGSPMQAAADTASRAAAFVAGLPGSDGMSGLRAVLEEAA